MITDFSKVVQYPNSKYLKNIITSRMYALLTKQEVCKNKKQELGQYVQPSWLNKLGQQSIYCMGRVQRKSFLQLAIRASWSWHLLSQTSFQLAPKTFWLAQLISQFFC